MWRDNQNMSEIYNIGNIKQNIKNLLDSYSFDDFWTKLEGKYNLEKLIITILNQYKFHDAALLFPLASPTELKGMTRDILKKGLVEKIKTFNKKIVDGRNRVLCCFIAGKTPVYKPLKPGISPIEYAISKNIHRRNLDPYFKAKLALELNEQIKKYSNDNDIISKLKGKEDKVIKKALAVREKRHFQTLAKKTGTTAEKILQVKTISEKAKKDSKVASELEKMKAGKKSIEQVYKIALKKPTPKKERKSFTYAQINSKLRTELTEWKEKYHGLKVAYDTLEDKYHTLKESIKGLITEDKNKKKPIYPTPKELRKAELI
jgi:hypothetical protein